MARAVAADLLDLEAVVVRPADPFTWASGLKAPIYTDNRLTLSSPEARGRIADGLQDLIVSAGISPEIIAGTATAGIPHATLLADRMALPLAYIRSEAKGHGKGNRIEGRIDAGRRVVVVEDLVSTGGSSLAAVEAVREQGAVVEAVIAVFSYGFVEARQRFDEAGIPLLVLTTFDVLVEVAASRHLISETERAGLLAWREAPRTWKP
ncbi:orotate phosphoribosyltransferase [soil metagenome]